MDIVAHTLTQLISEKPKHPANPAGLFRLLFQFMLFALWAQQSKATTNTLTNGLIAYYPFNGNANDASGNAYHGTVNAATLTSDRSGNPNSAYSFNGASSYIEIANGAAFNLNVNFTLSAWVNPAAVQMQYANIVDKSHSTQGWCIEQSSTNNNLYGPGFKLSNGGSIGLALQLVSDNWNYFAITKQGPVFSAYLNNVLVSTNTAPVATLATTANIPFIIGAWNSAATAPASGMDRFFKGTIDEFRLYNRVLSPSERTQLSLYNLPSSQPTSQPSRQPSAQPYSRPSTQPSTQPSAQPTTRPSTQPSSQPSTQPSTQPTARPSAQPSGQPSMQPSAQPSAQPSTQPSAQPTDMPSTQPSAQPSTQPSAQPTDTPSAQPSAQPSTQPSAQPTNMPSAQPSAQPSTQPSAQPTDMPSAQPSAQPSTQPSAQPTEMPSAQPSDRPSTQPSAQPTNMPSAQPSAQPSTQPSAQPTDMPSAQPSGQPSTQPSAQPTDMPSTQSSDQPSTQPSAQPTDMPSTQPSDQPSTQPSAQPTEMPSAQPSDQPSTQPSAQPTDTPSTQPSAQPSTQPITRPTARPSGRPSTQPITRPTTRPSTQPSGQPSIKPSTQPTTRPSAQPSGQPSIKPSTQPTTRPSAQPFSHPSAQPTNLPSSHPTTAPLTTWMSQMGESKLYTFSDLVYFYKPTMLWLCGSFIPSLCFEINQSNGGILASYAMPWDYTNGMAASDQKIALIGSQNSNLFSSLGVFDPSTTTFSWVGTVLSQNAQWQAVAYNHTQIAVGGYDPKNNGVSALFDSSSGQMIWGYKYQLPGLTVTIKDIKFSQNNGFAMIGYAIDTSFFAKILLLAANINGQLTSINLMTRSDIPAFKQKNYAYNSAIGPANTIVIVGNTMDNKANTNGFISYIRNTAVPSVQCSRELTGGKTSGFNGVLVQDSVIAIGSALGSNNKQNAIFYKVDANCNVTQAAGIQGPGHLQCYSITATDTGYDVSCEMNGYITAFSLDSNLRAGILPSSYTQIDNMHNWLGWKPFPFVITNQNLQTVTTTPLSQALMQIQTNVRVQPVDVVQILPENLPSTTPISAPSSSSPTSSHVPTGQPSSQPSSGPSSTPTQSPTSAPSARPTNPTSAPSSSVPTMTYKPSKSPTVAPTRKPISIPTFWPTNQPSLVKTQSPTVQNTAIPTTHKPSQTPSAVNPNSSVHPTYRPSFRSTSIFSETPTSRPSKRPIMLPSASNGASVVNASTINAIIGAVGAVVGLMIIGSMWAYRHYFLMLRSKNKRGKIVYSPSDFIEDRDLQDNRIRPTLHELVKEPEESKKPKSKKPTRNQAASALNIEAKGSYYEDDNDFLHALENEFLPSDTESDYSNVENSTEDENEHSDSNYEKSVEDENEFLPSDAESECSGVDVEISVEDESEYSQGEGKTNSHSSLYSLSSVFLFSNTNTRSLESTKNDSGSELEDTIESNSYEHHSDISHQ